MMDVCAFEGEPTGRQLVDVWRHHFLLAVGPEFRPEIVDQNEQDVFAIVRGRGLVLRHAAEPTACKHDCKDEGSDVRLTKGHGCLFGFYLVEGFSEVS